MLLCYSNRNTHTHNTHTRTRIVHTYKPMCVHACMYTTHCTHTLTYTTHLHTTRIHHTHKHTHAHTHTHTQTHYQGRGFEQAQGHARWFVPHKGLSPPGRVHPHSEEGRLQQAHQDHQCGWEIWVLPSLRVCYYPRARDPLHDKLPDQVQPKIGHHPVQSHLQIQQCE